MNENANIQNWIKENLEQPNVPYNDALWQKLDAQLIPVREAYHKKQKRRVVAYWSIAATALLLTTIGYFATQNNNTISKSTVNKQKENALPSYNKIDNQSVVANNNVENTIVTKSTITETTINTKIPSNKNNVVNQIKINNTRNLEQPQILNKRIKAVKNNKNETQEPDNIVETIKQKENYNAKDVVVETKNKDVVIIDNDNTQIIANTIADTTNLDKTKETTNSSNSNPLPIITTTKKPTTKNQPMNWYVLGGINMASPFYKSGYVGGVLLEKQIQEKRIYAGVKVAFNRLSHQLIATKNTNIFPVVADAVINKMTTIQFPFGYQFPFNKKLNNPTYLNVGFEPTLFTGIQTIYYDDNGVPGGVRTPVINSPLLYEAINKFNVSFTLGLKKQVTQKVGAMINAGYGLINITDKQYYNKTGSNNNLKYLQLSVLYRL